MRKILLIFCSLLLFAAAFGQTTELGVSLNSGLFSFTGRSATSSSFINYSDAHTGYTNNPYGSTPGLSYGIAVGVKHVIRRHWLFGVDAGYEVLRSTVRVDWISEAGTSTSYSIPAHGQAVLTSRFIDLSPYVGYRLNPGKVTIDLTGGIDLAHCLNTRETGNAKADNGTAYHTSVDRKTITMDVRPRFQVTAGYRKVAVYIGYSFGLSNYMAGYTGGPTGAYGRLLRFGIVYRLL